MLPCSSVAAYDYLIIRCITSGELAVSCGQIIDGTSCFGISNQANGPKLLKVESGIVISPAQSSKPSSISLLVSDI